MNYVNNGTDWREYRKSTHLASVDIEILQRKGHNLIFTIARCQREYATNINGKTQDADICYFTEKGIKPMVLNSKNKTTLSGFAVSNGCPKEFSNMLENFVGLTIELWVDPTVKMKGQVTGGIRIRPVQPKAIEKQPFTQEMFEKAKQAGATVQSISEHYVITEEVAKMYNEFLKVK